MPSTSCDALLAAPCPVLWALMDCNNFYASCERLFRPDLTGRPIVVLSNNDGCIVSRSAEAKALGIPMGEPEYKARPLLRQHKVAVFSSNYALYGDISQRVMDVAETLVPLVEVYSIDEAFLRLDGLSPERAVALAQELRQRVQQWVGITVSIGLGPSRTLAKLSSHMAKKNGGVFAFPSDYRENGGRGDVLLAQTHVGEVWGIGRRQVAKLSSRGITTALALRDKDDLWLRTNLTVTGLRIAMELRGISCIDDSNTPTPRRTLVSSRSFRGRVTEKPLLAEALILHATQAGERLRRAQLLAGGMAVHIRTSRHAEPFYSPTVQISLPEPSSDTPGLIKAALRGLDAIYQPDYPYAKVGIMLYDLGPLTGRQASLLDSPAKLAEQERSQRLMLALDAVNTRFGKHSLHYAGEGLDPNAAWKMRQDHRSPRATTCWEELPEAKCK